MFCDEVTVEFIAGRGGNGCVAFRREKFVPRGGPSGGEGGKGGSIFLEADENINTLAQFNTQKIFRADSGKPGQGKDCGGSDAPDLILSVPIGTMIFDEKKKTLLGDLTKNGERFLVARGGKGGFGNAHFKSSTRQAPTFAEFGEPGEEKKWTLELKLVADVGIIGLPSVGKSTLISRISNARPKIADYHFTTIIPNLGLVTMKPFGGSIKQNFLACDLPGLIEDAHKGKGLGIQFLKHVARNRVLVHLIDVNALDPVQDFKTINAELKAFDKTLAKKPQIVAFNKIDTIDNETLKEITQHFIQSTSSGLVGSRASAARGRGASPKRNEASSWGKRSFPQNKIFAFSCVTGKGLKELLFATWKLLEKTTKKPADVIVKPDSFKIFRPHLEEDPKYYEVKLVKKGKKHSCFSVTGRRIEQIVIMTDFLNPEGVARVYDVFEKMSIQKRLRSIGAKFGDEILVGKQTVVYRW